MTVGEIRWVEMPARGGHAQAGRRPPLLLANGDAPNGFADTTHFSAGCIALCRNSARRAGWPERITPAFGRPRLPVNSS